MMLWGLMPVMGDKAGSNSALRKPWPANGEPQEQRLLMSGVGQKGPAPEFMLRCCQSTLRGSRCCGSIPGFC